MALLFLVLQASEGKREASEDRQTHATGKTQRKIFGTFPRRACLALYARFVLRLPEKREQIAPALQT